MLTPGTPSERARIEAAGGWITEDQELVLARLHHMKLEDPLAQEKLKKKNYLRSVSCPKTSILFPVSQAMGMVQMFCLMAPGMLQIFCPMVCCVVSQHTA